MIGDKEPRPDYLTDAQVGYLLRPIEPHRVGSLDGKSHVEAYEIRAHLTRVFGFARWSADLVDLVQLYDEPTQTRGGASAFKVAYRATVRLTVHAPNGDRLATYTEAAVGGNVMPETKRADGHDFAVKTAESQAFKRCAANLGDQFGLSLYDQGSTDALVGGSIVAGVETVVGESGAEVETREVAAEDTGQDHAEAAQEPATDGPDVEALRAIILGAQSVEHLEASMVEAGAAGFLPDGAIAYSDALKGLWTVSEEGTPCTLWALLAGRGKALRA